MVMGNVSGREEGEGSSGVIKDEHKEEELTEFAQRGAAHASYHAQGAYPLHFPRVYQPQLMSAPQGPLSPLTRPGETMQVLNRPQMQNIRSHESSDMYGVKQRATMLRWSHGGNRVAITGSWDNWATIEPMQSLGKDFVIVKMLPLGVYQYRFVVDEQLQYAPDFPWESNGPGGAYNVLDLQDHIPEASEHLAEFESPPSPASSYDNNFLNDSDFSKPPPDLPQQIQMTPLNQSSATAGTLSRPRHTVLNHLYIQNSQGDHPVALGSTFRFRQKYVTVVLYKASRRNFDPATGKSNG